MDQQPPADPAPQGDAPGADANSAWIEAIKAVGPVVQGMFILSVTAPAIVGFLVAGKALADADGLRAYFTGMGDAMKMVVMASAFGLLTGCALAPTYAFSIACGVVFGPWTGGAVAVAGVVIGAMIGYLLAALFARHRVMAVLEAHPRARIIRRALVDRTLPEETGAVALLRFPPNSPFALTNLIMSSAGVRVLPFMLGTAVGMAPRTVFAAWLGSQFTWAEIRGAGAIKIGYLVVLVIVFFVAYRVVAAWVNRAIDQAREPLAADPNTGRTAGPNE